MVIVRLSSSRMDYVPKRLNEGWMGLMPGNFMRSVFIMGLILLVLLHGSGGGSWYISRRLKEKESIR